MNFKEWLETATKSDGTYLSKRTINHYYNGFEITSKEMYDSGVINKSLFDMKLNELDLALSLIFNDESFIEKNQIGHNMYSNGLKRYRCFVFLNTDLGISELAEEVIINNDATLTSTEKEMVIKARIGQGLYRDNLIEKYCHKCIITNIDLSQVLIASHIKPWAICNNQERVDVNNGLLLSATYDRLFDSGLITFTKKGEIKLSKMINSNNASKLNLKNGIVYNIGYKSDMSKYLLYHNEYIFVD